MISGNLSIKYGLKGPTGHGDGVHHGDALHSAKSGRLIEVRGFANCDGGRRRRAVVTELAMGGFAQARALSHRKRRPGHGSRPWDRDRDGLCWERAAGCKLVLEE